MENTCGVTWYRLNLTGRKAAAAWIPSLWVLCFWKTVSSHFLQSEHEVALHKKLLELQVASCSAVCSRCWESHMSTIWRTWSLWEVAASFSEAGVRRRN